MTFNDSERLDFLEKWEVSSYEHTRFTLLTQHVKKETCRTLREFCDYGINFERMIDENHIDIFAWHSMTHNLQERVISIWDNFNRPLTSDEFSKLTDDLSNYWKERADELDK